MRQVILTFAIITLFICLTVNPVNSLSLNTMSTNMRLDDITILQSFIEISWSGNETQEPIVPRGELRQISLNINYGVTGGVFDRLIKWIYRNSQAVIQIEIVETPQWATANLASGTLQTIITPGETKTVSTVLSVQVDEDAPAFRQFAVKIKATTGSIKGPYGRLTLINGTEVIEEIHFMPAYKPLIKYMEESEHQISPAKKVNIPIEIENLGNGLTNVSIEIEEIPKNWDVSIDPAITIPVEEKAKIINLTVIPHKNFKNETITLKLTPRYANDFSFAGETVSMNLTFITDGRKENEIPSFEVLTLICAIGFFLIFENRKRFRTA